MSDYAFVADRAKKAYASVARLESALMRSPNDRALSINLASMRRVADAARVDLERLAEKNHIEVCQYRMVPDLSGSYGLAHVSKSLLEYQNLFSQVYDAVKNGKKSKAIIGKQAESESMMDFAYSYAGSLGVVLLARSEASFFGGNLDKAIEALYQVFDIDDQFRVRDIAQSLGRAVVTRIHDWSVSNISGGFSTDIRWKRSDGRLLGQMIDKRRMEKIVGFIEDASDEVTEKIEANGMLVAVSLPKSTFQIVVPDGETYSGRFASDFVPPQQMTVGRMYSAKIEIAETLYYATQKTKRSLSLLSLDGPHTVNVG